MAKHGRRSWSAPDARNSVAATGAGAGGEVVSQSADPAALDQRGGAAGTMRIFEAGEAGQVAGVDVAQPGGAAGGGGAQEGFARRGLRAHPFVVPVKGRDV